MRSERRLRMSAGRINDIYQKVTDLPVGEYDGFWSGDKIEFAIDKIVYYAKTDVAIRGMNIPCRINVGPVWTTVRTIQYDKPAS